MRWKRSVVAAALGLAVGCASARPAPPNAPTATRQVAGRREAKQQQQGRLRVTHVSLTAQGSATRVRASVQSTYGEPVEGLRYVVTVYRERAGANPLTTYQYEDDSVIEPGRRAAVAFDLEGVDLGGSGESRYTVDAAPKRVGDHEFLPPPGWKP